MKILVERDSFLSNYEVGCHLHDIKKRYHWSFTAEDDKKGKDKHKKRFSACGINLEVMTRDTLAYFEKTPTGSIDSYDKFVEMMEFLNSYDLLKAEKLQIVNSLPRSLVVLYSIVDECDQRFSEEQSEAICTKINELFPGEDAEEEEAGEDGGEEQPMEED
ncbi:DNA-directed RNA polymerase III subunit RPC9 [Diutina catenulata]